MNIQSRRRLFIFLLGFLLTNVHAEEKNFGKNTPSKDNIIEFFKSDSINQPEETSNVDPNTPSIKLRGIRTRSLKFIDVSKSHQPAAHVLKEKAISMEILFDYNSAMLTPYAKEQLRPVGSALASNDLVGFRYRIEGHTDIIGGNEFNMDLSRRRAKAVQEFLTQQSGLAPSLTQIVGKGKNDLADKNNPTSEVNRRVRIVRLGE